MALATNSTPGSIVIAGDLTGTATSPQLRPTGVVPGTYENASFVVDAKGRVVFARDSGALELTGDLVGLIDGGSLVTELNTVNTSAGVITRASVSVDSKGRVTAASQNDTQADGELSGPLASLVLSTTGVTAGTYQRVGFDVDEKGRLTAASTTALADIALSGDVIGNAAATILNSTGVPAGSYSLANITVDSKGRITAATSSTSVTLSGDVSGPSDSLTLSATTVTPGTYPTANMVIDAKGRVTSASIGTTVPLSGDVTGTLASTVLPTTGVTAGSYADVTSVTVNSKGCITAVSNSVAESTYSSKGYVQVASNAGLTVSGGTLYGTPSNGASTMGVVVAPSSGKLVITSGGEIDIGASVPTTGGGIDTFTKTTYHVPQTKTTGVLSPFVPDLDQSPIAVVTNSTHISAPINKAEGDEFTVIFNPTVITIAADLGNSGLSAASNGTITIATSNSVSNQIYVITDAGSTLTSSTNAPNNAVVWNGSVFCGQRNNGYTVTSPDGLTWTVGGASYPAFYDIVWNGSVFCATTIPGTTIYTSTNGLTWTARTLPASAQWHVAANNWSTTGPVALGTLYAVSHSGDQAISTDNGVTWTAVTTGAGTPLSSVVFGWDAFYALTSTGYTIVKCGTTQASGQLGDATSLIADEYGYIYANSTVGVQGVIVAYSPLNTSSGNALSGSVVAPSAGPLFAVIDGMAFCGNKCIAVRPTYDSSYKFANMESTNLVTNRNVPGKQIVQCVVSGSNQYCTRQY